MDVYTDYAAFCNAELDGLQSEVCGADCGESDGSDTCECCGTPLCKTHADILAQKCQKGRLVFSPGAKNLLD